MADAVTILIKYVGRATEDVRRGMNICRVFLPNNSYVDSPVYTDGYANADEVGDGNSYGKSIYATNVNGWGTLPGLVPMASTTVKFAEFQRAVNVAIEAKKAGTENKGISFQVEGYQEELYWDQMAPHMVEQGFYIEVGDKKYGEDPDASNDTPVDPDDPDADDDVNVDNTILSNQPEVMDTP